MGRKLAAVVGFLIGWGLGYVPGWGQVSQNVVTQKVATGVGTAGGTFPITTSNNIGQINHQLILVYRDNGGSTCSQPQAANQQINIILQGSYDNVTFYPMPQRSRFLSLVGVFASQRFTQLLNGSGSFPFLQVFINNNMINANCLVDVYYSGNVLPQSPFDWAIGTAGTPSTSDLTLTSFSTSATGDTTIVGPTTGLRDSIYELVLFSAAANTIAIKAGGGAQCNTATTLYTLTSYTGTLILPNTQQPHFSVDRGCSIIINLGAATAVSGYVLTRLE